MVKRGFSFNVARSTTSTRPLLFIAWTIVAAYLVVGVWSRLRFLGAFASPVLFVMGVFALMPALDPAPTAKPNFHTTGPACTPR